MINWLPETDDRPHRPDLPWLRNLSWTKIHAMQMGFGVGLIIFWGMELNLDGIAFSFAVVVSLVALGKVQKDSKLSNCDHDLGVHDLQEKPWYGLTSAVITWAVLFLTF